MVKDDQIKLPQVWWGLQRELFLSEVSNRETMAAIEVSNDMYCLQKRIEKFPQVIFERLLGNKIH